MQVKNEPLEFYIQKLRHNEYFSMGLVGDGEVIAMRQSSIGEWNALGEIYTLQLGEDIRKFFSLDKVILGTDPNFANTPDGAWLDVEYPNASWHDGVIWDRAVRLGELAPFIKQLREMPVYVIGNKHLRKLDFLKCRDFIEIPELNCHPAIGTIAARCQNPGVYLISAGLAAIPLIVRLYNQIPNSWFLDMGSIWDVFCGIGLQRGWRQELEANPLEKQRIINKNLENI